MTGRLARHHGGEPPAGLPPVDEFASQVLDVVDSIPAGRVMSYGDIAEYLGWVRGDEQRIRGDEQRIRGDEQRIRGDEQRVRGDEQRVRGDEQGASPGPRQVGRVMSVYGGAVAWWRVIHADGTPAPGHEQSALARYLAEGTPLRSARPVRVDMRRARWPGATR